MSNIEITEGLDENCLIVTEPYSAISKDLTNGAAVTAHEEKK